MTAMDILRRCREAVREHRQLETLLQRCLPDGIPPGVRVQQYTAGPPGTNVPDAASSQLCDGLHERLAALDAECARLTAQAREILRPVERPLKLMILTRYYLCGGTDQEIAAAQALTREHVTRLRLETLREMQILH